MTLNTSSSYKAIGQLIKNMNNLNQAPNNSGIRQAFKNIQYKITTVIQSISSCLSLIIKIYTFKYNLTESVSLIITCQYKWFQFKYNLTNYLKQNIKLIYNLLLFIVFLIIFILLMYIYIIHLQCTLYCQGGLETGTGIESMSNLVDAQCVEWTKYYVTKYQLRIIMDHYVTGDWFSDVFPQSGEYDIKLNRNFYTHEAAKSKVSHNYRFIGTRNLTHYRVSFGHPCPELGISSLRTNIWIDLKEVWPQDAVLKIRNEYISQLQFSLKPYTV
jgi:hypothetical protein